MINAYCIVGLGFGDEGKGTMVDYLTRENRADLVVRFNGAGQAAHNVVTANGTHHTFSHFGSGSLAGARTHLSQYMFVEPLALMREAGELSPKIGKQALDTISIDPRCVIITPYHRVLNHSREYALKHGSVGIGFGEAVSDSLNGLSLTVQDILDGWEATVSKLANIRDAERQLGYPVPESPNSVHIDLEHYAARYVEILKHITVVRTEIPLLDSETVIFEGAQGILLDQEHGFAPHNSWSDCTTGNARKLMEQINHRGHSEFIGVTRTYHTRHGNGPFPTEDVAELFPAEQHNACHPWMGKFRVGHFDHGLHQYSISVSGGIDVLAVTHADVPSTDRVSCGYDFGSVESPHDLRKRIQHAKPIYTRVGDGLMKFDPTPIKYISAGPRSNQKVTIR